VKIRGLFNSLSPAATIVVVLGALVWIARGVGANPTDTSLLGTRLAATETAASITPVSTVSWDSPVAADQPAGQDEISPAQMTSPDYGVQVFLFWRDEVADRDLRLVKEAGFRWVKQEFAWREIEGAGPGIYDWSYSDRMMDQVDAHELNIIARVGVQPEWAGGDYPDVGPPDDYQDFISFLSALVSRYQGRVDAYQIWNEPNLAREWGGRPPNPAEYTEMLKMAYQTVKAIDPDATVISAGLAPTTRWDDVAMPDTVFIQGMYDAGAAPHFDLLGAHGAGYKVSPETSPDVVASDPALNNHDPSSEELKRIYCFRHIEDVRAVMLANGDGDKRIALLEFGWTTDPRAHSPYRWHAVTDGQQADYLVRAFQYASEHWRPWIAVMSLIYMPDSEWGIDDEQTFWSVIYPGYPDLRMRPAYMALKSMVKD
jgi:hypothetical protein